MTRSGRRAARDEAVGDLADRHAGSRAHVVDLARRRPAQREEPVRAHDVAHVAEVADRIQRSDADLVLLLAFGGRDAVRERGNEEPVGLARTGVREGAHADDVEPVRELGLQRQERRGDLAHAVRRRRAQRRVLVQRQVALVDEPVLLGAADHEHAPHAGGARRVEHVGGAFDVHAEHCGRIVPRLADVRDAPRGGRRPRAGAGRATRGSPAGR